MMRSLIRYRFMLICLLWVAVAFPAPAEQRLHGRPAQIISGNELLLIADDGSRQRIRLSGIRLPHPKRHWSQAARRHLRMLVLGRQVQFIYPAQRKTGTIAGRLLHGGADINRRLLDAGLALFQSEKTLPAEIASAYIDAERAARQAGLGIWRDDKRGVPPTQQRPPRPLVRAAP